MRRVTVTCAPQRYNTLPEPESRYGLSLAHNDAFATIARSMFLACTFVPTSETLANPFDSRLLRSVRFRGRTGALSMPGTRFPRRSPTFPNHPRSPLPLRSSFENPPDQSVQRTTSQEARLAEHPICLLLPAALSFDYASDQCSKLRFVPLGYRSVNPGTESIMNLPIVTGQ